MNPPFSPVQFLESTVVKQMTARGSFLATESVSSNDAPEMEEPFVFVGPEATRQPARRGARQTDHHLRASLADTVAEFIGKPS